MNDEETYLEWSADKKTWHPVINDEGFGEESCVVFVRVKASVGGESITINGTEVKEFILIDGRISLVQ